MNGHYDVAVIGGGIVGLAHAWMARRRGLRVLLLERSRVAEGASVRNFGMIWPIGQPAGALHELALRAREFWVQLGELGVVEVAHCGSIHLAHREDELAVLEEFCDRKTHGATMLRAADVLQRTGLANPDGLLGGMFSPTELRVDPRTASARIASWLQSSLGVECHFASAVTRIDGRKVIAADQRCWTCERVIVCSGSDLQTLYPEVLADSGLQLCKLQMLRTAAQSSRQADIPHIASGLTLRHYHSFQACPSHGRLRQRIAEETPELDRFGIHVMASAFPSGEVVLGDSHEYGDLITPFDRAEIDDLILRELRKVIRLDNWNIAARWHGVYAKHPTLPVFEAEGPDGTKVFVGTGGAGMTMAFGLADQAWQQWNGETNE